MEKYILTSHQSEIQRLKNQGIALKKSAQNFINIINIQPHWKCLDVACGVRGILDILYPIVSEKGELFGLDFMSSFLDVAKNDLAAEGMHKIQFVQSNAEKTPFPDNYFDFIHARLFFIIYPVKDKTTVLKEIHRICKPGGIIAFQESVINMEIEHPHPVFYELKDLLNNYFTFKNLDSKIGLKIKSYMESIHLENILIQAATSIIPTNDPASDILIQVIENLKYQMIADGYFEQEYLDLKLNILSKHLQESKSFITYPTMFQAYGRKK